MRSLFVALILVAACRGNQQAADDMPPPDAPPDVPDGVGCTPLAPRSVAPETFVGPTGLQARMTALIDGAQKSLDVQMYLFTVTALADRIVAAHQRGVAVRVILDPDEAGNDAVRPRFAAASVPVRNAPSIYTFSHAKYLVIDRQTAVVMSMNFNGDAMTNERNYGFVDRDPEDVGDVQAIFAQDWATAGGEPAQPADLTCTRLLVSPNNSRQRVLDLINGAKTSLDVEAMYVTETTVRSAITSAKARGVTVRVILEASQDSANTIPTLKAAGIPVHDAAGFFLHAKLIIADGVAFIGSENYSQTSLTRNREVGALVFEPAAAAPVQQQFETDFANTPAAP